MTLTVSYLLLCPVRITVPGDSRGSISDYFLNEQLSLSIQFYLVNILRATPGPCCRVVLVTLEANGDMSSGQTVVLLQVSRMYHRQDILPSFQTGGRRAWGPDKAPEAPRSHD